MTVAIAGDTLQYVREKAIRDARSSFAGYVRVSTPGYVWGWFNELMCEALQQFYLDVQAGKNPRYMILAPPRSGKSELASRAFPAWCLGRDSHLEFISTAYSTDLASTMSTSVRRRVDEPVYHEIFPETCMPVPGKSNAIRTADYWEVVNSEGRPTRGSYLAAGVGAGITGRGFNIGLIDDPVKDWMEASSPTTRERIWTWYKSTFWSRRYPKKSGIILIMTRWNKDDLGGRLKEEMETGGEEWSIFSFPMVAEKKEFVALGKEIYHTRDEGDILFPEQMPQEFVDECRKQPEMMWSALYQQNPIIAGGNFFKRDWFAMYQTPPDKFRRILITSDTAMKTGEQHDFSVFQVWGMDLHGHIWLLEQTRGKWEAHILKRVAKEIWGKWGRRKGDVPYITRASGLYVEDKASGTGLVQEIRAEGVPCLPVARTKDKVTRAIEMQPSIASGLVHLPMNTPWINEFLAEVEEFSLDMTHKHDDQVDAMLDAIDIMIKGAGGVNFGALAH